MRKVLYLSLTGMTEPLGRSQVLEYLIDLSKENKIFLISFEREQDLENISQIEELINQHDIHWDYLIYSNKYGVFSTVSQIVRVMKIGAKHIKQHGVQIIHARSMIPATIGMILKKIYGVKLLFDIRGFAIDEKVDSRRLKKDSLLFKTLKTLDDYFYREADHVVTLTHKAKDMLHDNQHIYHDTMTVIPTCASKKVFKRLKEDERELFKSSLGYKNGDKIIIHTGTVSGWYDFDKEVKLVKELISQSDKVHLLVLNKKEHSFINEVIDKYNLPQEKVKITSSSFDEMYKYLSIANASLFFIKPSYSKQASAPTKFAENVACYLPSITNTGVGDMEYYLKRYDVGYLVDLPNLDKNLSNIAEDIINKMEDEIIDENIYIELFSKHFDKEMAVRKYNEIYLNLIGKK